MFVESHFQRWSCGVNSPFTNHRYAPISCDTPCLKDWYQYALILAYWLSLTIDWHLDFMACWTPHGGTPICGSRWQQPHGCFHCEQPILLSTSSSLVSFFWVHLAFLLVVFVVNLVIPPSTLESDAFRFLRPCCFYDSLRSIWHFHATTNIVCLLWMHMLLENGAWKLGGFGDITDGI